MSRRWCERCGNDKRFIGDMTLQTADGSEKHQRGLMMQDKDEEFYWIIGTSEILDGRGPSFAPGTGHIFCGPCGNNMNIADSDIQVEDVKGYNKMERLL